jgi:NADH dehydrogenase FAD-containing subunit
MATESDAVRVWLVERGYNNRDLIILKYATPDGERLFRRELSAQAIDVDTVTAAKDVSPENLEAVGDGDRRERYANEVARMADEHDPDDAI